MKVLMSSKRSAAKKMASKTQVRPGDVGGRGGVYAGAVVAVAIFNMAMPVYSASAYAAAEPAASADRFSIDEITVTARKRSESLQQAPVAVSAFTTAALEDRSINDTVSLTSFVPNLNSTTGLSGGSHANYFIRGVGQIDHVATVDSGVSLYLDGIYLGRANGANLSTLDVERIEVLRGPQGTLFGKNTLGGAIHVITAKPGEEFAGVASAVVGSRDWAEFRGWVNVPLEDNLFARISLNAKSQDGWATRIGDGEVFGDRESISGRARVLWIPSETVEVDLSFDISHGRGTSNPISLAGIGSLGFYPPDFNQDDYIPENPYTTYAGFEAGNDIDVWGLSGTVNWDVADNVSLKSITAYRTLKQITGNDFDGSPIFGIDQIQATDQWQFSEELQLSGLSFEGKLNWMLGLFYFKENVDQAIPIHLFTPTALNQVNYLDIENIAGFGQATLQLTNQFSITAGARHTYEKKEQTINNFFLAAREQLLSRKLSDFIHTPASGRGFETIPSTDLQESWTSFTPKVSLDFQVNDEVLAYASFSKGFKGGGFNGRPTGTNEFLAYDPERLNSWELGLKSEWFERRLRFNAAAFYNDYSDIQLLVLRQSGDGALSIFTQNAAKAELYGLEVESVALLAPGLEFNLGLGYLHNKYKKLDPGTVDVGVGYGDKLPQAPKWSISAGLQYEYFVEGFGTITPRVDYSYKTKYYFFAANNPLDVQDSLSLVNARLTYTSLNEAWSVSLFANNLFDKFYYAQREDVRDAFDVALNWPAQPRVFGMEAKFNF